MIQSNFSTVNRDRNFNKIRTTSRNKVPRLASLAQVGGVSGQPGFEGDIILNRADRVFYGFTGQVWTPLSGAGGVPPAPSDGPFVVAVADPDLPQARVLQGANLIDVTDGGAGTTMTVDLTAVDAGIGTSLIGAIAPGQLDLNVLQGSGNVAITGPAAGVIDVNLDISDTAGVANSLIETDIPGSVILRGLQAVGTGLTVTENGDNIDIENIEPASIVTLADGAGVGQPLVLDGTGPDLTIKRISQGAGISVTTVGNDIQIDNNEPASSVTLGNAGANVSLVVDGVGPTLSTRSVSAGSGITFTTTATNIQIANNAQNQDVGFIASNAAGADITNNVTAGISTNGTADSIAAGISAQTVIGDNSIAIGNSARTGVLSSSDNSIAIGRTARTGEGAAAISSGSIAIGREARTGVAALGTYSIAIGNGAQSASTQASDSAIAIGHNAIVSGTSAIAIGNTADALFNHSIAIGDNAVPGAIGHIAIGQNAITFGDFRFGISNQGLNGGVAPTGFNEGWKVFINGVPYIIPLRTVP